MTVRGSAASAKGERILAGNDLAPAAARVRVAQKIVETFVRTLARRPGDRIGRLRQRLVEALVEGSHAETLSPRFTRLLDEPRDLLGLESETSPR